MEGIVSLFGPSAGTEGCQQDPLDSLGLLSTADHRALIGVLRHLKSSAGVGGVQNWDRWGSVGFGGIGELGVVEPCLTLVTILIIVSTHIANDVSRQAPSWGTEPGYDFERGSRGCKLCGQVD
jgi:hypothetical protein